MIKKIIIIFFILFSFLTFYKINEKNYEKHNEIKRVLVSHPENIQKKEIALATSFWFKNLRADLYWLRTIQYIWWNAFSSQYKKYLYKITDLITELNPYFESPYLISLLLLPDYNPRYEEISWVQQENHVNEAEIIWLKWIKNFCDLDKINLIDKEENLNKLWTSEELANPCLSFNIPYFLAYLYFFYKNDPISASKYYKVASNVKDSPEWAKIMAAIMQWKWWNREKSYFMFLNLAKFVEPDNEVCNIFWSELENVWINIFLEKNIELNWENLQALDNVRKDFLWESLDEEKSVFDWQCNEYINKAFRELNLYYLENANKKFKEENNWKNAKDAKELFDEWYIDYIPVDYQQMDDYWIIYRFNENTQNFDYQVWYY